MKSRPILIFASFLYILGFSLFYTRYVPLIKSLQIILIPLLLFQIALTILSVRYGTLSLIFFIPLLNSLLYFFHLQGVNPLLILFLGYFLGVLIHQIFRPLKFEINNPLILPLGGMSFVLFFSAFITFWRYSNFFPLFDSTISDLAINTLNVTAGEAIRRVIFDFLSYSAGFVWFIIILTLLQTHEMITKAIVLLATSTSLSLAFGMIQLLFNPELGNLGLWLVLHRINALFSDPNSLGVYLALVIPLFVGALLTLKKTWKYFLLLPVATGIYLIPHIGSRSGFLGIFLAAAFLLLFLFKTILGFRKSNPRLYKRSLFSFITAFVMIGFLSSLLFFSKGSTLYERFKWNVKVLSAQGAWERISMGRSFFWTASGYMIREYPLSGIGVGSFTCELPNTYKKYDIFPIMPFNYYQKATQRGVPIDTAGNFYLQIASEFGLIGFLFFAWIFLLIFRQVLKVHFFRKAKPEWKYLHPALSAGILSMFVIFLFGAHILNFEIQLTFWLIVGLLFITAPSSKEFHPAPRWKKLIVAVLLTAFGASHLWNSTHSLSLQHRTKEFGLAQNFGLYKEEKMNGQEFRWSGRKAGISFFLERPVVVVPILASHPDIRKKPVRVKIHLAKNLWKEKRLLDEIVLRESRWQEFRYDLSQESDTEFILLIEVDRTWQPLKELRVPDPRNLGIALGKLKFEGAPTEPILEKEVIAIFSSSDWQGPLGSELHMEEECWINLPLPQGKFQFEISARGDQARGEWPYMVAKIDEKIIGGQWVSSADWSTYTFQTYLEKGIHKIKIRFINDYYDPQTGEDRNLFVGDLKIYNYLHY